MARGSVRTPAPDLTYLPAGRPQSQGACGRFHRKLNSVATREVRDFAIEMRGQAPWPLDADPRRRASSAVGAASQ